MDYSKGGLQRVQGKEIGQYSNLKFNITKYMHIIHIMNMTLHIESV